MLFSSLLFYIDLYNTFNKKKNIILIEMKLEIIGKYKNILQLSVIVRYVAKTFQ